MELFLVLVEGAKFNLGGTNGGPSGAPFGCCFFGPQPFAIFNSSHQGLSNEGSSFILSSLEVGDCRNFGLNLRQRQDSKFAKFCLYYVKIDHAFALVRL